MLRPDLMLRTLILAVVLLAGNIAPAFAVNPDEMLDDPKLEQRAREISAGVRCMVCQNQSIDDSDASLARDLRLLIRDRLVEGDTNDEVLGYLVDRYGEFVLLKPRFSVANLALWVTPLLVLIFGLLLYWRYLRGRDRIAGATTAAAGLSREEKKALSEILTEDD
jgi:cytochrome c-type biogenesis protein CcmH